MTERARRERDDHEPRGTAASFDAAPELFDGDD
jgi:hypothetical protein